MYTMSFLENILFDIQMTSIVIRIRISTAACTRSGTIRDKLNETDGDLDSATTLLEITSFQIRSVKNCFPIGTANLTRKRT